MRSGGVQRRGGDRYAVACCGMSSLGRHACVGVLEAAARRSSEGGKECRWCMGKLAVAIVCMACRSTRCVGEGGGGEGGVPLVVGWTVSERSGAMIQFPSRIAEARIAERATSVPSVPRKYRYTCTVRVYRRSRSAIRLSAVRDGRRSAAAALRALGDPAVERVRCSPAGAGVRARGCGLNARGPLGHGKSHACVGVAWLELPWLARGGPRVIDGILARVVLGCLGLTECVRSLVCDAQTDDRTERGHGEVGALPQSLFPSSLPCASRVLPRADLVRPPARAGCRCRLAGRWRRWRR